MDAHTARKSSPRAQVHLTAAYDAATIDGQPLQKDALAVEGGVPNLRMRADGDPVVFEMSRSASWRTHELRDAPTQRSRSAFVHG
jgi:hypothetical protein